MNRNGRKKGAKNKNTKHPDNRFRLSVRLTEKEHEEMARRAKEMNMTITDYVIHCCLGDRTEQEKLIAGIVALAGDIRKNGKDEDNTRP